MIFIDSLAAEKTLGKGEWNFQVESTRFVWAPEK